MLVDYSPITLQSLLFSSKLVIIMLVENNSDHNVSGE